MILPGVWLFLLLGAPPESLNSYVGRYILVPAESSDLNQVIDQTAASLNFLVRPIARSRLRKTQIAFPSIRISRDQGEFRIAHELGTDVGHRAIEEPVRAMSPDGKEVTVRLIPGPPLAQTYESDEGVRTNRYLLSADKARLTVEVQIVSPRLKKPVEYRLSYRRQ